MLGQKKGHLGLKIDYRIVAVPARCVILLDAGAKRHPQIFNLQYSIINVYGCRATGQVGGKTEYYTLPGLRNEGTYSAGAVCGDKPP